MLNHVFFSGKYDLLDYARMGAIIGHEITHGFDKFGKDYNSDGVVVANQWSNATAQGFADRETCFKNQYSKYYIEEINAYVNFKKVMFSPWYSLISSSRLMVTRHSTRI